MPLHKGRRYDHVRDNRLETSREAVPQMPNGLALKRALSDDKPERLSQSDAERSWNRARAQPAFLPAAVKQRCRPPGCLDRQIERANSLWAGDLVNRTDRKSLRKGKRGVGRVEHGG